MAREILYLSAQAVEAVAVPLDAIRESCAEAYAALAQGAVRSEPKLAVTIAPGHSFHAMPVAWPAQSLAALKWVGLVPVEAVRGAVAISALVVLSDVATGEPVAIMDGGWITAVRTAALTALAATYLARKDARSIGFIGCGLQARSHLAALRRVLPGLNRAVAMSRTEASAASLANEARAAGMEAETSRDPRKAVVEMDVVVTSVPGAPGLKPFLDPGWLKPGSFASAVDLGRTWQAAGLPKLDLMATDNRVQSETLIREGKLVDPGPFHADLAQLVSGAKPGRRRAEERAMFLFAGDALADLAAGRAVYEAALKRGLGVKLPR